MHEGIYQPGWTHRHNWLTEDPEITKQYQELHQEGMLLQCPMTIPLH